MKKLLESMNSQSPWVMDHALAPPSADSADSGISSVNRMKPTISSALMVKTGLWTSSPSR